MTGINNTNISPVTKIVDNQSSQPNRKKLLNGSSMAQKCLLLFVLLLSIIGLGVLTGVIIIRSRQFIKKLKVKDKSIFQEQAKNNQTLKRLTDLRSMLNQTERQLIDQLERSLHKQEKQNETIQQLHNLRSFDNQKIQNLTNQLQELREEQLPNNQTVQRLTSQLQQLRKEQVTNNQTIQQLTSQLQQQLREEQVKNNQTTQRLNDQLQQSLNKQREQNETIQQLTNQLKQALEKLILSTETGSTPKLGESTLSQKEILTKTN
jgi:myosin heavy subunit